MAEASAAVVPAKHSDEGHKAKPMRRAGNLIPKEIDENAALNEAITKLPSNYSFEIKKSVWKINEANAKRVGLQFPEGLLVFSCVIADILEAFTGATVLILGDVTYGACCVEDLTASALGCDFLIHYGHSCLVPITVTKVKMLYVFVDIAFDVEHLIDTIKANFPTSMRLALLGTIQFSSSIHTAAERLKEYTHLYVPQAKPLSSGETLGCTSPKLADVDAYVFVADGRFHLESCLIGNPGLPAYRYNPYSKKLTREAYDHETLATRRKEAIDKAQHAKRFGIILGTLGRQGNPAILHRLRKLLQSKGREYVLLLMSEVFPAKMKLFRGVDAWIQVACPRLSVDWGTAFDKPLLTPYEAFVTLQSAAWGGATAYPMDYYAKGSGPWTNYYEDPEAVRQREEEKERRRKERAARRAARQEKKAAATQQGAASSGVDVLLRNLQ